MADHFPSTGQFGAGAVGGSTVIRLDPAIVVREGTEYEAATAGTAVAPTMDDIRAAFGG